MKNLLYIWWSQLYYNEALMILVLLIIIGVCFAVIFAMFGFSGLTQPRKKMSPNAQASRDIDQHPSALT